MPFFIDQNTNAFKEVAIVRHPRIGEYAFGFITSTVILHRSMGEEELSCVYVPTNHLYLGDIFLISSKDILKPNLSVREGIGKTSYVKTFMCIKHRVMEFKASYLFVFMCCRACYLWGYVSTSGIDYSGGGTIHSRWKNSELYNIKSMNNIVKQI